MKWRKKPVVIEAIQWDATAQTFDLIKKMGCPWEPGEMGSESFFIQTLEGNMLCKKGDYIIKGLAGEFYPCKPDIFEKSYDRADETEPSLTTDDETKLQEEAEKLYPHPVESEYDEYAYAVITERIDRERCAYSEGRRLSYSIQKEMGLLLMDKDAEIEALKGEVAEIKRHFAKFIDWFELAGIERLDDDIRVSEAKKMIENF